MNGDRFFASSSESIGTRNAVPGTSTSEREKAGEPISQPPYSAQIDRLQAAALVDFCQALMNSNEFVYRN